MGTVTIVGSDSPSAYLARGKEATVQLSPQVERWIAAGFVTVKEVHDDPAPEVPEPVEDDVPDPAPDLRTDLEKHADEQAQKARDELGVPPRSGAGSGREDWAEFLAANTSIVTEGKSRDQLIAEWDAYDSEA